MPCFYCGVKLRSSGPRMRTKDHVVPKSKGGTKTVFACIRCNSLKADMSLEEFRALRGGVEFWGEMKIRLADEESAWVLYDQDQEPRERKKIVPIPTTSPVYTVSIDPSRLKPYTLGKKIKGTKKPKPEDQPNNLSTSHIPQDLRGYKFGLFTVVRRITGKWEVECICGTIERRSTKAVINPANTFDACIECRKPMGSLRSEVYRETGIQMTWEECFQRVYGSQLNNGTISL